MLRKHREQPAKDTGVPLGAGERALVGLNHGDSVHEQVPVLRRARAGADLTRYAHGQCPGGRCGGVDRQPWRGNLTQVGDADVPVPKHRWIQGAPAGGAEVSLHHVGSIEKAIELHGPIERNVVLPRWQGPVQVPPDEIVARSRGHVVALGDPSDPIVAVAECQ